MSAEATACSTVNGSHLETGGKNKKYVILKYIYNPSHKLYKFSCLTTIQIIERNRQTNITN